MRGINGLTKRAGRLRFALAILASLALVGCASPAPTATPTPKPTISPTTTTPTPTPTPTPAPSPTPTPTPLPGFTLTTSVNPPEAGSVTPSSGTYDRGNQLILKATSAGTCWAFDRWSGDASGDAISLPVTMDRDKNFTANFVKLRYSLTTSVVPAGSGKVGPTGGTYDCGAAVTVVATPAAGFGFAGWGGDASGNSASANLTMQSDKKVVANFKSLYQVLKRDMPAGSMALNTISFLNTLKVGDRIQGFVELTGDPHPEETVATWHFTITGPSTVYVEDWDGNAQSTPRHEFDKPVKFEGVYTMKVSHTSRWPKTVSIQIQPGGWQ